ncbi:MAG: hypothetical protein RMJ56_01915 [Gemmataceae bacterium]|nr:hypothetical protein [Gemmata sp.]MDW8196340.1 hypothetical protein [Gemmataceae bacterium]
MPSMPQPAEPSVPRVLLFGHRGAGKSALIGALLQAGETQSDRLQAELVSSSVDLPRIREAVYSDRPMTTPPSGELVSYTIHLRPRRRDNSPRGEPLTILLHDCDGRAAEELLKHPEPITQRDATSPLAQAVIEADAIMLLVDASSTEAELQEAFDEFERFLKLVARTKTDAREVGGLPIFLVLTQCDRLATPHDTLTDWEQRVAARCEAAWTAFTEFLQNAATDEQLPSPFLAFGSVDLTVKAAAVRLPALRGGGVPKNQPYGVAELFRECFAGAKAHCTRVRESARRLKWTVRSTISLIILLLTTLGVVTFFPPAQTALALAEKVRQYRMHEPPAAIRLADGQIERNKKILLAFTNDAGFPALESELRTFVQSRLQEIEDYENYRRKLAQAASPASARNIDPQLQHILTTIQTELALPAHYSWEATAAAELRNKWLADVAAIMATEPVLVEKYAAFDRELTGHMLTRRFDAVWLAELDTLLAKTKQPPFPPDDPIPGSPRLQQPRGEPVTYRDLLYFDGVTRARETMERTRQQLLHLRDLADALGLTSGPDRPPAVLVLPDPAGADSVTLPRARWTALVQNYPASAPDYSDWEIHHFYPPTTAILKERLKDSFDTGIRHVQKLITGPDTPENWKALTATLAEPAFRDWGRLLHLLARLQRERKDDPLPPDPIVELARFLHDLDTKALELDLRGWELAIPLSLTVGLDRVEVAGPLTITVTHGSQQQQVKFVAGRGELREKKTVYRLTLEGSGQLKYYAGDDLQAEIPVRAGAQELKLLWDQGGANTFRFDRLYHPPRLVKPSGAELAADVVLTPIGGTKLPRLPLVLQRK